MSTRLALLILAAAVPVSGQSSTKITFNVNKVVPLQTLTDVGQPADKNAEIKVVTQSGSTVVVQGIDHSFSSPIVGTMTLTAPSGQFTGTEVVGSSLNFFVFDKPYPTVQMSSSTNVSGTHGNPAIINYPPGDTFVEAKCVTSPCSIYAMPVVTADQRHDPAGGRNLLAMEAHYLFQGYDFQFIVYFDYVAPKDKITIVPYPPTGDVAAGTPVFYSLAGFDLESVTLGEIHIELRDDKDTLLAASSSRQICTANQGCPKSAAFTTRLGVIGQGTETDPYVRIARPDYLNEIPDGTKIVRLKGVLSDPKTGKTLAESTPVAYGVNTPPQVFLDFGTLNGGDFTVLPAAQKAVAGQSLDFISGVPSHIRGTVLNANLQPGEKLKMELICRQDFGSRRDPFISYTKVLASATKGPDQPLYYQTSEYQIPDGVSLLNCQIRATLPNGAQYLSPPLPNRGIEVAYLSNSHFNILSALTPGGDEPFSHKLDGTSFGNGTPVDSLAVQRCDTFRLADKTIYEPSECPTVLEHMTGDSDFAEGHVEFTLHVPTPTEPGSPIAGGAPVSEYCFAYYWLPGSATVSSPRTCYPVSSPPDTPGRSFVQNVNSPAGTRVQKWTQDDFLQPPSAVTSVLATAGMTRASASIKAAGGRPLSASAAGTAPDFLAVRGTVHFDPPMPAGSFSGDLVFSFTPDDFPDDPQFDPTKLQIVAVDPSAGTFTPLPSQVDTTAGTVTTHVEGLTASYGLAQIGPFSQKNLGGAALTAGGGDSAGLVAVNAGGDSAVRIEVYGANPASDSKPVSAGQAITGTVNQLIPAESGAAWLLTRAPAAMIETQLLGARNAFDLLDPQSALTYSVFPAVEQNDLVSTEFHIANPSPFASAANLVLFGPDGTQVASNQFEIAPKSRLILLVSQTPFTGYAVLSADQALFASAVMNSGGGMAVYNGLGPSVNGQHIVAPALGPDTANLYLVNNGTADLHFTASAYDATGASAGTPLQVTLPAHQQYMATLSQMFSSRSLPQGTIAINSDSTSLSAELVFRESLWQKLAVLPLGADPQTSAVIPYQANDSTFSTTVNVASTGPVANLVVGAIAPDGTLIGTGRLRVPANGLASASVPSIVSGAKGFVGGYLRIASDQPVVSYASLTSTSSADFATIRAQPSAPSNLVPPPAPHIGASPASFDFGSVSTGQSKTQKFTISNAGQADLHIASAKLTGNPAFSLTASFSATTVSAGSSIDINVVFKPTAVSSASGTLTISSDDPANTALAITLTGAGISASGPTISVSAPITDFGTVDPFSTKDLAVTIQNTGSSTLSVTPSVTPNPPFSIVSPAGSLSINAGTQQTLTLRFRPTTAGAQTGTLTLTTDDLAHPSLSYKFTGTGGSPAARVTVPNLDFGIVSTGLTKDLTLTIGNTGTAPLSVTPAFTPNPPFSIVSPSGTLSVNGGTQQAMTVRFSPTSAGAQTGTLALTTNDLAHPSLSYKFTGTGFSASTTDITLKVDGGVFDTELGYPAGVATAYFVNRLTPPSYPATLKSVQVYFSTRSDGLALNAPINILAAGSSNGSANFAVDGSQASLVPAVVSAHDTFITYAVPARTIISGDFIVGFSAANPANAYPADVDGITASQHRSYASADGTSFALLDSTPGLAGNLAIRAVVTIGGSSGGSPVVSASPASLNFGNVTVGQTSDQKFTLTNTGTADLSITSIMSNQSAFTIIQPPAVVGAGKSADVAVRFTPSVTGSVSGAITVASKELGNLGSVAVTGTGQLAQTCQTAPANQVSWWRADGNATDSIGGNNGTLTGNASFGTGEVGQAFQFDGSTGYVSVGNTASLRLSSAITIEGWINPKASPTAGNMAAVLTKWAQKFDATSDSDSYGLWMRGTGSTAGMYTAVHLAGASEPNAQGGVIPLNTWSHVAMTFDSTSGLLTLYVNGQSVASATAPGAINATSRNVLIGREDSTSPRLFSGLIDELSVYSRALSAAEIQSIFKAGSSGKCH